MSGAADHDVIVAGGGIAGAVTALALARAGFSVTLVDDAIPDAPGETYVQRVSSINLHSESVLRALGAWPVIERGRVSAFDRILVWDNDHEEALTFDAADAGVTHLACILENDLVAAALHECLRHADDYRPCRPARIETMFHEADRVQVRTSAGETLRARLLVGADGAGSRVRELAGIVRDVFDYRQRAVVARVCTEKHHGHAARQVFRPAGPVAFLPLADGTCSIVWSLDVAGSETVTALDDGDFRERLGEAFGHRLGDITDAGPRAAFALVRSHAKHYHAGRVALVGDACHTVHPLAGLGANQGIADATALVDALAAARSRDQDIASPRTLAAYQRRRRPLNAATLATMDLFHLGFANHSRALSSVRSRAFSLVNRSRASRRFFVRQACGLAP